MRLALDLMLGSLLLFVCGCGCNQDLRAGLGKQDPSLPKLARSTDNIDELGKLAADYAIAAGIKDAMPPTDYGLEADDRKRILLDFGIEAGARIVLDAETKQILHFTNVGELVQLQANSRDKPTSGKIPSGFLPKLSVLTRSAADGKVVRIYDPLSTVLESGDYVIERDSSMPSNRLHVVFSKSGKLVQFSRN